MKVLLLNPPFGGAVAPPLGLGYISSVLEAEGHHVQLLDLYNMSWSKIQDALRGSDAEVFGISSTTSNRFDAFELAKEVKSYHPKATVVMGGAHPTLFPEQCLQFADIVVRGEGEYTMLDLMNAIEGKMEFKAVKGISFKDGEHPASNPDRPLIADLDALPFPDFNQFPPLDSYVPYEDLILELGDCAKLRKAPMISSRGCPFRCAFCSSSDIWGHSYRFRSAKNVVDEMELLNRKYKVRYIRFFDDNFTCNVKRVEAICDEILERGLDVVWRCEGRVNRQYVAAETLSKMARAGCHLIEYGVESGSPEGLKVLNKAITLEEAARAVRLTKAAGIKAKTFFIVGNPVETSETVKQSWNFINYIKPDILTLSMLQIYPGTALFERAAKEGLIDDSAWLHKNMGARFTYGTPGSQVPVYLGKLSQKEAEGYLKRMHNYFYLRKYVTNIHYVFKHAASDPALFRREARSLRNIVLGTIGIWSRV